MFVPKATSSQQKEIGDELERRRLKIDLLKKEAEETMVEVTQEFERVILGKNFPSMMLQPVPS